MSVVCRLSLATGASTSDGGGPLTRALEAIGACDVPTWACALLPRTGTMESSVTEGLLAGAGAGAGAGAAAAVAVAAGTTRDFVSGALRTPTFC